jgi:hypothetical protein
LGQPDSVQVHDFNPGIAASGLFWTTYPFPPANVAVNLNQGSALAHATNWAIPDYGNIVNSIGLQNPPAPPIPSSVSFAVSWAAKGPPTHLPNATSPTTGFTGTFQDCNAQIAWSANSPSTHFQFVSDPAASSTTVSGVIGAERNGRFYPRGG